MTVLPASASPDHTWVATAGIRAIFWDLSGTVTDDEPVHREKWEVFCERRNIILPNNVWDIWHGIGDQAIHKWLCDNTVLAGSVGFDAAKAEVDAYYNSRLPTISLREGVTEAFNILAQAGFVQGIVTNDDRLMCETKLSHVPFGGDDLRLRVDPAAPLGSAGVAQFALTRDDVQRGKPDPEILHKGLVAANDALPEGEPPLGVLDVLLIEDSRTGGCTANAIGMPVLHYAWSAKDKDFDESVERISSGAQLVAVARQIVAARAQCKL